MPYDIGSGNNFLPGLISVMAAIKQGKLARQQHDLNTQEQQQRIKDMQTTEKRTSDQDSLNNRLNGIGPDGKTLQPPPNLMPAPNADPLTTAKAYIAIGQWYDSQGARNIAKDWYNSGSSLMLDVQRGAQATYTTGAKTTNTNANTGLTKAKTTTEKHRPGLIDAQTKRITTIQPQQFQQQQQNEMTRSANSIAAAQERSANAQAAAWERLLQRLDFDKQQQQRSFTHSDKTHAASTSTRQDTAQAETLRARIRQVQAQAAKTGKSLSTHDLRAAAKKQGYSDAVIDLVLPKTPQPQKPYFSQQFINSVNNERP